MKLFLTLSFAIIMVSCGAVDIPKESIEPVKSENIVEVPKTKDIEKITDTINETVESYSKDTNKSSDFENDIGSDEVVIDIVSPEVSPISSEVSGVE